MVFHNVFQLKNQGENSKTPPHALSIAHLPIADRDVIRDFGTFPEISTRYLDNLRFDDYPLKEFL